MTPVTLALGFTCDWCGAALAFEEHQPDCRKALEEGSTYDDLVYDQSMADWDMIDHIDDLEEVEEEVYSG
jgi:hypothetical protein